MNDIKYNLNIHVFTTKFVIERHSEIVHVLHEIDGDWQFLGIEENLTEDDAMIIALSEMLQHDPTLEAILDLPEGYEAVRDKVGGEWGIHRI